MKKILLFLFIIISPVMNSQIMGEDEVYLNSDLTQPKFNGGGIEKFTDFLHANIDKTKIKKSGNLVFSFVVTTTGEIEGIKIIEYNDATIATEIIRVVRLAPKWQPGFRNGKPVALQVKIPLRFK
ncbi:MAG TPA: energy transducer TonB [Flavobacterium sp.]|nr:energy transducer TonB [Flavobacterium sp.]